MNIETANAGDLRDDPRAYEPPKEYTFTPAEAAIFRAALTEAQAKLDALNALVRLVAAQQKLEGNWSVRQDGGGLVKAT